MISLPNMCILPNSWPETESTWNSQTESLPSSGISPQLDIVKPISDRHRVQNLLMES